MYDFPYAPYPRDLDGNDLFPPPRSEPWPDLETTKPQVVVAEYEGLDGIWRPDPEPAHPSNMPGIQVEPARVQVPFAAGEDPVPRQRHRKPRRTQQPGQETGRWERLGLAMLYMTIAILGMVCVLGGTVTHGSLRHLAGTDTPQGLAAYCPLLVYGPWTVASLSILHATFHRRRAPHAWCVVLFFSVLTIVFCVHQAAPLTVFTTTAASLPPVATVICLHQLVRQITLTRPLQPRRAVNLTKPWTSSETPG
ncbi:hypothetical protein SAMN05216223_11456 [Actinacidiphila yanglinensis]|uniref:DUF2637 domain-containing protein n=1 Tax=Actinacidiphila yanglinensis TaxID=310779 RepID=A0A1H6DDG0_9ACTN|nr:DUF2637 domain-containing protein [Actinacidiphila yanglinensis]SEG83358.1 hypothetical protein SAMN05216223_11456 [Actinacidiphila yanglinensis]